MSNNKPPYLKLPFLITSILIVVFFGILGIFFEANASHAVTTCTIRNVGTGTCLAGEAEIVRMDNPTTNAPAEMPGQTGYSYAVCCSADIPGIGNSCTASNTDIALRLESITNSHVERNDVGPNYTNDACLSHGTYPVDCRYAADCSTLGANYECLASLSSDTNAHMGDCNAYPSRRLCCVIGDPGGTGGGSAFFESGTITLSDTIDLGVVQTVATIHSYTNPVVVAFIPTRGGGESIDVRVRNVTGTSFEIFMEEPDDETHAAESVSYLVVEQGTWTFGDGTKIEAGIRTTSNTHEEGQPFNGDPVSFSSSFSSVPAIVATLNTYNNGAFKSTIIDSVSSSGFTVEQEEGGAGSPNSSETIGWVAMEQISGTVNGFLYEAGSQGLDGSNEGVDDTPDSISFIQAYGSAPDVIVNGRSGNGDDGYWARGAGTYTASTISFYAEEDQILDLERNHIDEEWSYIAFEPGANGYIGGGGGGQNLFGWAWSENIGWVSFNCVDLEPTNPGKTCLDAADPLFNPAIHLVDYAVNLRTDDFLEGYAWSENIGWISFNLANTAAPPGPTPAYDYSGSGFIAQYDRTSLELRGWARAISVCPSLPCSTTDNSDGWDGWIKLHKHPSETAVPDYGVDANLFTDEFEGWAWGSGVVGWVSFNHKDCDPDEDGSTNSPPCPPGGLPIAEYFVTAELNSPPVAYTLSGPLVGNYQNASNVCFSTPFHTFTWSFNDLEDGHTQTAYQLQASTAADFSVISVDTGITVTPSTSRAVTVAVVPVNQLGYGNTYVWRVRVFDSNNKPSPWAYPPSPLGSPTPPFGSSFVTAPHLYPDATFTFVPAAPSSGEEVTFTEATTCYDPGNNPIACPLTAGNYRWDFNYPPFGPDATGQTATTTFSNQGVQGVAFEVTDADGFICRTTQAITTQRPLPIFRETSPTGFFDRAKGFLLASIGEIRRIF